MKVKTLLLHFVVIASVIAPVNAQTLKDNTAKETANLVQAGGKFITLLGEQVSVNDKAPNFKVVNDSFSPVQLSDFSDKNLLISVVPSLDTGVCSIQTKRFNEEASKVDDNIIMLTISNDLPFAQKRFCKSENIESIKLLSDSVWRDFGLKYGLLIKDMGLLTRAIFIINTEGVVVYKELVKDISSPPNYEEALKALKALPAIPVENEQTTEASEIKATD